MSQSVRLINGCLSMKRPISQISVLLSACTGVDRRPTLARGHCEGSLIVDGDRVGVGEGQVLGELERSGVRGVISIVNHLAGTVFYRHVDLGRITGAPEDNLAANAARIGAAVLATGGDAGLSEQTNG